MSFCVNLQSGIVVVVGKKPKEAEEEEGEPPASPSNLPLLNIKVEFLEGESEIAFVSPNSTLFQMHMPWLKQLSLSINIEPDVSVSNSEKQFESQNYTQNSQNSQNSQTSQNTQSQQQFQQYHTTTVSNNNAKFPYLKKDEYETWAMKMEGNDARDLGGCQRKLEVMMSTRQIEEVYDKARSVRIFRSTSTHLWSQVAITLKTKGGLDYLSFDDLYNKLRTLEIDVKGGLSYDSYETMFVCGSKFHLIKDCDFFEKQLGLYNKPMWNNVANIHPFVPRAASVPAGSRNQPASVTAGSAFPAGSRNRPATVSADRHVPAGSSTRPTPVSTGRPFSAGWRNHAARPMTRQTSHYFQHFSRPGCYNLMDPE
ncbi:hypothetical protein Tco_0005905 [Tanacetum coccineum]